MFVDARTFPHGAVLDADLCIVGAGPSAIAIANELTGLGLRILMIESGGIKPEIRRKYLDRGASVGHQYYNLMFTRARAFGGTSSRWHIHVHGDEGWMARPLDPIDFEARPTIPWTGWPFDHEHLAPFYDRAHAISDLGPRTFAVEDWERPGMTRLPLPEDRVQTSVLQRGMSSFMRFRDQFAALSDVTVAHHATVVDIISAGEPPVVERVEVATSRDRRFSVRAGIFVLAAGGIENPRLLLSSVGQHPAGLGNGNDLVGRFFMEHLAGRVGFVRPADPSVVRQSGLYDSHPEGPIFVQAALTLDADLLRREGLPNMAFFLLPRTDDFTTEGERSLKALTTSVYRRPWVGHTAGHLRNVVADIRPTARVLARRVQPSNAGPTALVVRTRVSRCRILPHGSGSVGVATGMACRASSLILAREGLPTRPRSGAARRSSTPSSGRRTWATSNGCSARRSRRRCSKATITTSERPGWTTIRAAEWSTATGGCTGCGTST